MNIRRFSQCQNEFSGHWEGKLHCLRRIILMTRMLASWEWRPHARSGSRQRAGNCHLHSPIRGRVLLCSPHLWKFFELNLCRRMSV